MPAGGAEPCNGSGSSVRKTMACNGARTLSECAPQFAAQFVHDLVEQVGQQHHAQFFLVAGKQFGFFEAAEIGLQIRAAHRHVPVPDPRLESRQVLAGDDAQIHLLVKAGIRRVMERAHHPRHVAQRRTFDAPFADRHGRIAFKIQKDKIASRPEHLAQMQIAVDADAPGLEVLFDQAGGNAGESRIPVRRPAGRPAPVPAAGF